MKSTVTCENFEHRIHSGTKKIRSKKLEIRINPKREIRNTNKNPTTEILKKKKTVKEKALRNSGGRQGKISTGMVYLVEIMSEFFSVTELTGAFET